MKNKLFLSSILILTIFIISSCSLLDKDKYYGEFILDNPTEETITVTVNGETYELPPIHYATIKLNPGRHSMVTQDGENVDFIVTVENNGGVLNPTRSQYYQYSMHYIREGTKPTGESYFWTRIGDMEYKLPVRKSTNDIIIDEKVVYWQFPIYVPFDDVAYTEHDDISGLTLYKLFNAPELEYFIDGADFETRVYNDSLPPERPSYYVEPLNLPPYYVPDFKNEEKKKYAEILMEIDKNYGLAESPEEQRKIRRDMKAPWKAYVQVDLKEDYDKEDFSKNQYLIFTNIGKGVIILDN